MKFFKVILVSCLFISGFSLFGAEASFEGESDEVHVASLDFDHALCAYLEVPKDESVEADESKVSSSQGKIEPKILTNLFSTELTRLGVSLVMVQIVSRLGLKN